MAYGGPYILKDLTLPASLAALAVADVQLQFEALAAPLAGGLTADNFAVGGMSPLVVQDNFYLPNMTQRVLTYSLTSSTTTWSATQTIPGTETIAVVVLNVPRLYTHVALTMLTDFVTGGVPAGVFPVIFQFTLTVVVTDNLGVKYTIFNGPLTTIVTSSTQTQICLTAQAQDLAAIPNIVHTDLALSAVLIPTTPLSSAIIYKQVQAGLLFTQASS